MSDNNQQPPTLPSVLWQLATLIFKREAALFFLLAVVLVAGGASFTVWAQNQLDAGVAPVREELHMHMKAEEQRHAVEEQRYRQVKEDLHEVQMDIRALYRAVQTGRPQARLEEPLPPVSHDGGAR